MTSQNKKVLYIDLTNKTYDFALHAKYGEFIGGVGLGAKVLTDIERMEEGSVSSEPIIFSVGPLTGYFPYVSKTSVLFRYHGEIHDDYLGGSLASRIKYFGVDSIVLSGRLNEPMYLELMDDKVVFHNESTNISMLGLPGKRATLLFENHHLLLNSYFKTGDQNLQTLFTNKNLLGFVITGSKTFNLPKSEKYLEIYNNLLGRLNDLTVEKSGNPSCVGCPLGCTSSMIGETGGDFLVHSLVACSLASKIYSDPNVVFSCFDSLGSGYTHEDIEKFPSLVYDLFEELKK